MDWHPLIVHYPIALLPLSPLCDLGALWLRRRDGHHLAYGLLVLGALAASAAVLSGNAAAEGHWEGRAAAQVMAHEDLATWTLLLALGTALGRLPLQLKGPLGGWPLYGWIGVGLLVGVLVVLTGYHGGELVYVHGVGVGVEADG
ncbi:MAG: DUF2231 domain-containing protein [Candidatus Latescibacterota bacterium]|nr:DUF2231 domain-containing protein [Candidatus Latescibacterota bacterium]